MNIKVTPLDKQAIVRRAEAANKKAIAVIANALLKDCEKYVPSDTGILSNKGIRGSNPEEGLLIWDTDYAKAQYYGMHFHHPADGTPAHPEASAMWVDKALDKNEDKYLRMAAKIHAAEG